MDCIVHGVAKSLTTEWLSLLVAQLIKNLPAMQETPVWFLGQEDTLEKGKATHSSILGLSLVAQSVKNLPAMWETWVWSLGWEDHLEEGMATHSSILAWRIPMDRGSSCAKIYGSQRVGCDSAHTHTHKHTHTYKMYIIVTFFSITSKIFESLCPRKTHKNSLLSCVTRV